MYKSVAGRRLSYVNQAIENRQKIGVEAYVRSDWPHCIADPTAISEFSTYYLDDVFVEIDSTTLAIRSLP